jgi:FkbM family methyltransferase
MNDLIEFNNGFYWPKSDSIMRKYIYEKDRFNEPSKIVKYCKNTKICLQAGGNIGIYPIGLSRFFEKVITFEPELLNFECLKLNTENYSNIIKYQAALGDEKRKISIRLSENNNCGGHYVVGHGSKEILDGEIPMIRIDDLNLEDLDLLYLDVEGFEIQCLNGGIETIKKYKPIICAEIGWSDCSNFLSNLGYNKIDTIDINGIFKYSKY